MLARLVAEQVFPATEPSDEGTYHPLLPFPMPPSVRVANPASYSVEGRDPQTNSPSRGTHPSLGIHPPPREDRPAFCAVAEGSK